MSMVEKKKRDNEKEIYIPLCGRMFSRIYTNLLVMRPPAIIDWTLSGLQVIDVHRDYRLSSTLCLLNNGQGQNIIYFVHQLCILIWIYIVPRKLFTSLIMDLFAISRLFIFLQLLSIVSGELYFPTNI